MEFYQVIYKIASDNGLKIVDITDRLGRSKAYFASNRARGSLPKVDNAARILEACGYVLAAIPADKVPDEALVIDSSGE